MKFREGSWPDRVYVFFYSRTYQFIMKTAHRFGWHYAPKRGPMMDGKYYYWCQWCGLRGEVHEPGKRNPDPPSNEGER